MDKAAGVSHDVTELPNATTGGGRAFEYLRSLHAMEKDHGGVPVLNSELDWALAKKFTIDELEEIGGASDKASASSAVESVDEILQRLQIEVPSRLRSPFEWWVLAKNCLLLRNAAVALKCQVPPQESVIHDTLQVGEANAFSGKIRGSEEFVVISQVGLMAASNFVAKQFARHWHKFPSCPSFQENIGFAGLNPIREEVTDIAHRLGDIILAYLKKGHPLSAGVDTLDGEAHLIANSLESSFNLFSIGHDYGHVMDGHFGSEQSAQQVFKADLIGLALLLTALKDDPVNIAIGRKYKIPPVYFGPDFLFCFDFAMKRCVSIVNHGTEPTFPENAAAHPPPLVRQQRIRNRIQFALQSKAEGWRAYQGFARCIQLSFDLAVEGLKVELDRNTPLHPMWRERGQ